MMRKTISLTIVLGIVLITAFFQMKQKFPHSSELFLSSRFTNFSPSQVNPAHLNNGLAQDKKQKDVPTQPASAEQLAVSRCAGNVTIKSDVGGRWGTSESSVKHGMRPHQESTQVEEGRHLSVVEDAVEQMQSLVSLTAEERLKIHKFYEKEIAGTTALLRTGKSINDLGLKAQGEYADIEAILGSEKYLHYMENKAAYDALQRERNKAETLALYVKILGLMPEQEHKMDLILSGLSTLKITSDPELNATIRQLPGGYTFNDYIARARDLHSRYSSELLRRATLILNETQLGDLMDQLEREAPRNSDYSITEANAPVMEEVKEQGSGDVRHIGHASVPLLE